MKQSPLAQRHTNEPDRPANDRSHYAFIKGACLTLALTLTLAGALFGLKGTPQTGEHSPALSVEQLKPKTFGDQQLGENTSARSQPAITHPFHLIETKREVRSQTFYAHSRAQGFGLDFAAGAVSLRDKNATYPLTIDPVWTLLDRLTVGDANANNPVSFSVATVGGTEIAGNANAAAAQQPKRFANWNDVFAPEGAANTPSSTSPSFGSPPAFFVPPNLTLSGTCDTFGNSVFTIKNLGGAMTTNYTWEIYQNSVFLTSGTFLLGGAGTSSNTQQLTINGLYGNVGVKIKNGTTPAAVEILSTTAFCVERPTAFLRQASGQTDPTTSSPIKFAVTFSKAVTGFTNTDVKITGMAATPGITVTDSGDHVNYVIAITGMADGETVNCTIPQDSAFDANGIGNRISTYLSGDHTVTYHAPPNITLSGTCDLFGNSQFTITNIGGAMTVNYTWEIYQNNVFLTSGTFLLTKAGTSSDHQQLTINGLYGNVAVAIKNGTTFTAVEILRTTAVCVDSSPTVTINQSSTQADPTNASPIIFDVLFNTAVSGFINTDVQISGMAGTPVKTVTDSGDHIHFTVSVQGMADGETVTARILAGAAFYAGHQGIVSKASTSTDNHVTYDVSKPTVTINQASGQSDPTDVSPILFDVVFSEVITGFTSSDLDVAGTHSPPGVTLTDSGDHKHFSVAVTGMSNGDRVSAKLPAGRVSDGAGNLNTNSTSTDNSVLFADTTPPTVTLEQKASQADPVNAGPIRFTATFSEPIDVLTFTSGDVTLGGTAGATLRTVTEIAPNDHTTFDIAVSGMTGDGTVTASIPANRVRDVNDNLNTASTSTDNSVTYDTTPPTVTIEQASGQNDPANNSPINFQVVFSEPVTDFDDATDVIITGSAGAKTISISGGPTIYNVAVSGMTSDGTVIANIPATGARDLAQNFNVASTSSDNVVTFKFCSPNPIVTSTDDSGPNTLREALANMCAAPNNNITFNLGGPGGNTIVLTSGQLDIKTDVFITNTVSVTNGPLTIDGNNSSRVFLNEAGANTSISGLTITNGNDTNLPNPGGTGSGIRNDGTLLLSDVVITANHLVAQGEGGGIYNAGALTIVESTISKNVGAGDSLGVGIDSTGGTVALRNCTLNDNTGAGQGGGIRNSGGTFSIFNSTITGNSSIDGAGIYNDASGTLNVTNSTISRNPSSGSGGGLFNSSGTANLHNSIVALNTAGTAGPDIFGSVISQGFNLLGNNADTTITPVSGDQIGTAGNLIDPLLDILGNYGGPTQTLRLLTGSPAIDQGDSSGLIFDQRGLLRPVDQTTISNAADGADIGAFEMALAPDITPGGPTTFCTGGSVTLTSSSPVGNQWFLNGSPIAGETNQTYVATASGNYTVEANIVTSAVTTVTVNPIPSTPVITPGGPTTFCGGGSVALVSSSASGNQWYLNGNPIGGATDQTYMATASGDYTVVETANGCASSASTPTTVTVNPLPATPTVTPQGPTTFCDDDSVTLTSSSATGNQWFLDGNPIGGAIDQNYVAIGSGNYTVVVTANGCDSAPSAPTVVTVSPTPLAPTITPGGPTSFCAGGSVTLKSDHAGGNQWYLNGNPIGGATSQTYIATASGDYTATFTSSGCPSSPSAPITISANPIPPTPVITAGSSTTLCDGGSVTLTSSSANGNQWFLNGNEIDGAEGQTYVATVAGNYTDTVSESGCTTAASSPISVTVNPIPPVPSITPSGPTTFCDGGSVTLTSNSASGNQWYLNGNPIAGATNQTYVANASGNYTDNVTTLSCTSAASSPVAVTVNPIPPAPVITPSGPTTFCEGGSVTLTSNSASGNQWYLDGNPIAGATNQTYVANASGNYTDNVTTLSCTSAASTPIAVTVNPIPPAPVITPSGSTTFCDGGSVTLTSNSASGNQWYLNGNPIAGATNQTYVANASGNYTDNVTTLSCTSAASSPIAVTVNPIPPAPVITPSGPTTFCDGGSVTLTSNSASGNQWYLNGNPIAGATNQTYVANASGNYTDNVTTLSCTSAASSPIAVTVNPIPPAPVITPSGSTTFCDGGSVTLTSNSASGNQWHLNGNPIAGATSQTYVANASGNYTDNVTTLSCTSAASSPIAVTVNPIPPAPVITPGGSTTFCDGGSVTLTSNSASGNQWYLDGNPIAGATSQTYVANASGNYTDNVTTLSCTSAASSAISVTVNPIPPAPVISPSGSTTFCDGGSVTLTSNSASGNQWYLDGNPIAGATNQTYIANASGNYTDKVTALSCVSAASSPISVTVNPILPAPSITPSGSTAFCDGGSVTLNSSSASGNQWYLNGNPIAGATNQTYIANASGDYTVSVTDSGCNSPASAATTVTLKPPGLTVINANDSGPGSLRQAIADICDGGTISFNLGAGPHTIVLDTELSIAASVTIANRLSDTNGPLEISGNHASRVFNLNVAAPGVVTFSGLTISNGNSGAGNGGGVLNNNTGALTILNSTLAGNAANTGGAVDNGFTGAINIINSTFSLNTAEVGGGGIANAQTGVIEITNSTFSQNSTTTQGGGIFNPGSTPVLLRNSIIAVNTAAASGPDLSGAFTSLGHNLIGQIDGSTGFTAGTGNANGDVAGANPTPVDPRLGPLQNNGGWTPTRALLAGSPALDAGDNCVTEAAHCGDPNLAQLTNDQRGPGFARILDAAAGDNTKTIDIGAFESGPSMEDIPDQTMPEDTALNLTFKVGDSATAFDSITATSGNTTLVPNLNMTVGPDTASTRSLSITPLPNQTGTATITVTVTKTISGTVQSMSDTFVLTVTAVDDSPINNVPSAQTVIENGSLTFSSANLNQISISDIDAGPNSLAVTLTATNGTLTLNGTAGLTFTPPAPANDGIADSLLNFEGTIAAVNTAMNGMVFTPTPGYKGPANVQIQTSDKGFTGSGGPQTDNDTVNIAVVDGGTIGFSAPNFTINESAGTANITVNRTGGAGGEARVNYATSNGTALAGAGNDYLNASGQLIFADGVTTRTFTVTINNDAFNEPAETINLTLTNATGSATLGADTSALTILDDDPAGGYIKFSSANYSVSEGGGAATITVERIGSVTQAVTVDYATDESSPASTGPCPPTPGNTIASSRCDFDTAVGRLSFAAGDGSPKTFTVLINEDSYVEGPESLALLLSNLTGGAAFASPSTATLTIDDNLAAPADIIDDPGDFVRQHYHDFLNREPDPAGLAFWTNQITSCGNDPVCLELKRINVSAAFFLSIEFQATGGTAYLTNKVAYGGLPTYLRFERDVQAIGRNYVFGQPGAENVLEANKVAYFNDYVSRPEFMNTYNGLSDHAYLSTLILNTGVEFTQSERDALLNGLASQTETRATVLRKISEKPGFAQAEFNRMFVLTQYFGYLRRNPNEGQDTDYTGYDFWLSKLNRFNGNFIDAEMVRAFINSIEYRRRFEP